MKKRKYLIQKFAIERKRLRLKVMIKANSAFIEQEKMIQCIKKLKDNIQEDLVMFLRTNGFTMKKSHRWRSE